MLKAVIVAPSRGNWRDVAQGLLQTRHLLRVIVRPGEAQLLGHRLMPGLAADVFTAIGLSGQQQ